MLAGVRPEHLVVGPSGSADGVQATVQNVEWLGHESLVNLDVDGHRVVIRITGSTSSVEPGQVIGLGTARRARAAVRPHLERADQMSERARREAA